MKIKLILIAVMLLFSVGGADAYSIGLNTSRSQDVGDVDGDGDIDYVGVWGTTPGYLGFYENDGNGIFTLNILTSSLQSPRGVKIGDIDGDLDIDIVATSSLNDAVYWYDNDGSESFTQKVVSTNTTFTNNVEGVDIVDLDDDGNIDILIASKTSDKFVWLENDGSESFTPSTIMAANNAEFIWSEDIDEDGDMDLYVSYDIDNPAVGAWLENDGSESFTQHSLYANNINNVDDMEAVDFDVDGDIDIILVAGTFFNLYLNDGSESFSTITVAFGDDFGGISVGDFDDDGDNEIVSKSDFKVAMYDDLGGYIFSETIVTVSLLPQWIDDVDVDGDGALDLVLSTTPSWIPNWITAAAAPGTYEVNGIVYDAINGTPINTSVTTLTQSGIEYVDTTDANGIYNTTGFTVGIETTFNVTKTNYTHEEWSWISLVGRTYTIDQYMIPTNITFNGSGAVHGIVTYDPYHQAIENATVTISNGTWSNTTQTGTHGYYFFENLTVSDYNISAAATGYSTSSNVTVSVNGTTLQNLNLQPKLTLTVIAQNADNLNLITDYSIILEGITYDSVNGSLQIENLEDGIKDLILVADGYYATEKVIFMDSDTTTTILATQILGSGTQYAPHYVKFTVMSWPGTKYSGVDTVVYLGDTASGTLTLNGTTGSDGSVSFQLVENIQYTITFIDASQNINEERTMYPKDTEYEIIVFGANQIPDTPDTNNILFGAYGASINLTHGYINVSFNDTSATTTLAELWINDTNMTTLYSFNTTDNAKSWSQVVTGGNASYVVSFKLINTELSEPLIITRSIAFDDAIRVDLGFDEGWKYQLIAVVIISVIALLGTKLNAEIIAVITVLVAWLMVFFGWLQAGATIPEQITLGLMMLFATLISFGSVIRKGDER